MTKLIRIAPIAAALWGIMAPAVAEQANCRAIADDAARLKCFDAQQPTAAPAAQPKASPTEDPLLTRAKVAVRRQLRDPDSARFQDIKFKTVAGKKGLCGQLNAKNAASGMTGFIPFTYDGEVATILSFNAGPGNPTSMDADILGITLGSRLKAHDTWCK